MKHRLRVLVSVSGLLASTAVIAWPEAASAGGRIYRLSERSSYQSGCFPPCLCPLLQAVPVRGIFKLTPSGFDGLFHSFAVSDVNWIASVGDSDLHIGGSGTYRIGGEFALEHRLELDLVVNGGPAQHFDSGFMLADGGQFPVLNITVSINGMVCNDTVFVVDAAPVPPRQMLRYRLVSPSTFQEGCGLVSPSTSPAGSELQCECPSGPELPIRGTFRLVPLPPGPLFAEYAVADVHWRIPSATPPEPGRVIRIEGSGFYTVGGEFAVEQRLALDLMLGEEGPVHLDSGLVLGGGEFPARIAALVSTASGCFERVIDVHAKQGPRPTRP